MDRHQYPHQQRYYGDHNQKLYQRETVTSTHNNTFPNLHRRAITYFTETLLQISSLIITVTVHRPKTTLLPVNGYSKRNFISISIIIGSFSTATLSPGTASEAKPSAAISGQHRLRPHSLSSHALQPNTILLSNCSDRVQFFLNQERQSYKPEISCSGTPLDFASYGA